MAVARDDPGVIKFVLNVITRNATAAQPADLEIASRPLNHLIRNSAPAGHSSEVAWALWAMMVLECQPSAKATAAILEMEDDIVAVATRVAAEQGSWTHGFQSAVWDGWLTEGCFHEEHWLYAYEATQNGWCSAKIKGGILKGESGKFAKFLSSKDVTFLDVTAVLGISNNFPNY